MLLGMTLANFTAFHVAISLIGIVSGLIVVFGMLAGRPLKHWHGLFLLTTVLTSVTGFLFPVEHLLPSHIIGIISLIVLAIAIYARHIAHLAGGWRRTYVIMAVLALYLNCVVLVVQSFMKNAALKALAPTQKEGPFLIAQLGVMALFVVLGFLSVKKYRSDPASA